MIKITTIFSLVNLILLNVCLPNDTIKLVKPISLDKIGRKYAVDYLLIDYKNFQIGYTQNNGFFNHLSYPHDRFSQVYFRNCNFDLFETNQQMQLPINKTGFYVFDSCNMKQFPIVNVSGNIVINSTKMNVLTIDNTNNLNLTLSRDSSVSFVVLNNNKNMKIQLNQCRFNDSAEMRIFNSSISEFSFGYDKLSGCNVFFTNDTINGFYGIGITENQKGIDNYKSRYKYENIFTFYNCHINADFIFFEKIPNSTFIFNKCTFGPNTYLADMAIDRLIIRNCLNISEQLSIGFREKEKKVEIGLTNSNLDQIRFDFTNNMRLIFDSSHTQDVITNSYKSLLEKFNHEGKDRSYKLVDLQYRKYNQVGAWHFLNYIWWYHGYKPGRVFIWTIGFLFAFFLFNLRYWTQIHEAYPIVDGQKAESFNRKNQRGRFYSTVLLYTILIFFSLRVNFDKLKFKRLGFIYILLSQYIIGLWCLLFIIRFIFKL